MFRRLLSTPGTIHLGVCLAAALLVARPCLAQDEQETDADVPEVIDEIVVYGEMSLIQLRREWVRAEENLFEVFNNLNSNDEFDVECEFVTRAGTRRRFHVCSPKFALEAHERATAEMKAGSEISGFARSGATSFYNSYVRKPEVLEKDQQLWKELAALVKEKPELQQALADLVRAKQTYESERERRCDGKGFFCD